MEEHNGESGYWLCARRYTGDMILKLASIRNLGYLRKEAGGNTFRPQKSDRVIVVMRAVEIRKERRTLVIE